MEEVERLYLKEKKKKNLPGVEELIQGERDIIEQLRNTGYCELKPKKKKTDLRM